MVWEQGWARLVEVIILYEEPIVRGSRSGPVKCDWEFPKPCFRLERQFQALVRAFSRADTETNFSACLQEKGCMFSSLSVGLL